MKQIILLILLSGCLNTQTDKNNDSWKDFYLSKVQIKEGLVKVCEVSNPKESFVYYDEIFLIDDKIHLKRYDKDFNLSRHDINVTTSDKMTLEKQSYFLDDIGEVPVKIIKARTLFYKPNYQENLSKVEYKPTDDIIVTITDKSKFIEKQTYRFNGKDIECLKFSYNQEFDYQSLDNSNQNQKINSKGFGLYGEKIGLIYMEFIEFGDTVKYELKDMITKEEFEKNKL